MRVRQGRIVLATLRQLLMKTIGLLFLLVASIIASQAADANRLNYLDESDPFYPGTAFPKLTTPQWVGEEGVDAVVTLAIDDMTNNAQKYEEYLRPIIERLKKIYGRAPVSIMSNRMEPNDPQLARWLAEGLSIEIHTLTHPCPIMANDNFQQAADTFHGCVDLFSKVPGNKPVGFRTPCCDSLNTPSPRMFNEIFSKSSKEEKFLTLDSSVFNIITPEDKELTGDLVFEADGKERFRKYVPFPSFVVTVDNYPYPYLINGLIWEMPCMVPSDWEAQHLHGKNNPKTVEDWKRALDITVLKKGTFNFVFHPHGWIRNDQMVEFIDYAQEKYGKRVLFLNFKEVQERLDSSLLKGNPVRAAHGGDNGVRTIDINHDGYLDVLVGNDKSKMTRLWNAEQNKWVEQSFPADLTKENGLFASVEKNGYPAYVTANGAWQFNGQEWVNAPHLLNGLDAVKAELKRSAGARFLDVNNDGRAELIVSRPDRTSIFAWSETKKSWSAFPIIFPQGVSMADAQGQDNGLRFVDLNEDGYRDIVYSNAREFGAWLYVAEEFLRFKVGWHRELVRGKRGDKPEIPMIVRDGEQRHNGAWFKKRTLWVQNENTAKMPDLVDRLSFDELLSGLQAPGKSPEEALRTFQLGPDLQIELVAHEPQVEDPIALEFGPDGKMWVAEMRDYPNGSEKGGAVRFLEDRDGDGKYENSVLFAEELKFPNGVMPYRKGVLVSVAPDILYLEDTDKDGKADVRKVLYTGFGEGNQQHRVNGFEYGLDNWIHVANGDSGGQIRAPGGEKRVSISGRDFRFHPLTGEFEATAGQTQFGRRRDDWGNWFGNANYNWGWHYFLPEHYLTRNPHLAVRNNKKFFADYADASRIFTIGRLQQRFNDIHTMGFVTSACSITPNRDELFGPGYANSIFISEPAQAVVHRENLVPNGVTFSSRKPEEEKGREFLASTDTWFRPCGTRIGPDGALYIADMYRQFIEHPEWIPQDVIERSNLRAGDNMGRIYRVYPKGKSLRRTPDLARLSPVELAKAMESPSGWQRDQAQRLLVEGQEKEAVLALTELARKSDNAKVRVQALCTLDGLDSLSPELLINCLEDKQESVREHAIRLSERFLRESSAAKLATPLFQAISARAKDQSVRVRYQAAFTLGEGGSEAALALASIAESDRDNDEVITAILTSAHAFPHLLLEQLIKSEHPNERLVQELTQMTVKRADRSSVEKSVDHLVSNFGGKAWQLRSLAVFVEESRKRKWGLDLQEQKWVPVLDAARKTLGDASAPTEARQAMLVFTSEADLQFLASLLNPSTPLSLQRAVLRRVTEVAPGKSTGLFWSNWRSSTPELRATMLELILQNGATTESLLDRLEKGEMSLTEISPSVRERLLQHSNKANRERAGKLFASQRSTPKGELVRAYLEAARGKKGNPERGRPLFETHCAVCHKAGEFGTGGGPNLAMLQDDSDEILVAAILDPNRAVEDKFRNCNVTLKSGDELSGILLNETGNAFVLMTATGQEHTILRADVEKLDVSTLSMMPEGFEQIIPGEQMPDLLAFIRSAKAGAQ